MSPVTREQAETMVVETAGDLLGDRIGVIQAARDFCRLAARLGAIDDAEFMTFAAIDSETDHLPVGDERGNWDPLVLKKQDDEIRECEEFYRMAALDAARALLARYRGADAHKKT